MDCLRPRRFAWIIAVSWASLAAGLQVDDFALLDQHGERHELNAYFAGPQAGGTAAKAVVLMVQGNGCPVVRNALADLRAVRTAYEEQGVVFLMINSNLQDNAETIRGEADEFGIDLPILVDEAQQVGMGLALTRTAEVLVLDRSRQVAYRGPINDRLSYERQRAAAQHHYLAQALDAVLAGQKPAIEAKGAIGCLINFPARLESKQAAHPSAHAAH